MYFHQLARGLAGFIMALASVTLAVPVIDVHGAYETYMADNDLGAVRQWLPVAGGVSYQYWYDSIPAPNGGYFDLVPSPRATDHCRFRQDTPFQQFFPYQNRLIMNYLNADGIPAIGWYDPVSWQAAALGTKGFDRGHSLFVSSINSHGLVELFEVSNSQHYDQGSYCLYQGSNGILSGNTLTKTRSANQPPLNATSPAAILFAGNRFQLNFRNEGGFSLAEWRGINATNFVYQYVIGDAEGAGYYIHQPEGSQVILKQSNTERSWIHGLLGNALKPRTLYPGKVAYAKRPAISQDYHCYLDGSSGTANGCLSFPPSNLDVLYKGYNPVRQEYLVEYFIPEKGSGKTGFIDQPPGKRCVYIGKAAEALVPECTLEIPEYEDNLLYQAGISDDGNVAYVVMGQYNYDLKLLLAFREPEGWSELSELRELAPLLGAYINAAERVNLSIARSPANGDASYEIIATAYKKLGDKGSVAFWVKFRKTQ